ncbi:hypothetical protein IGI04_036427 [Brassica rapa subsp. trilocularis]|uniref:AP-4 complex subunit epsilon n=1 Tax=Brassica rapa subsp. trilocularis TaxID=1813537 RepID=A0ABQ7LFF0_BRACM|nr:hypothetical protein IGI04_036427 [Brassica rapa subsp. trilocularis]
MEQLKTIGRELAMGSQGGFGQSKEFLDLVKSIGEARSKAEEDRIVLSEIDILKRKLLEPDIPKRKMKEYIIRLVYIEMLGHDASFGYIHAVKMTHDDNLLLKRTGYLAVTLFLNEDHDLIILIVNTIQKDLRSDNYLVVCAALNAICRLINEETIPAVLPQDLVSSFVSILKQVTERRLPKSYDYHQMPAPFIQIKLLKIMALLGSGDKSASEIMYMVLGDLFRKCDSSTNIGNAILYECIRSISCIIPSPKLLEAAADAISKFLKSDSHNLKYMGIDGLGRLIKISPDIAEQHQLAVIDCLEDPDDTLKRKTFELLYKMTKSSNVEVIVDRMIDYMISINDNHYKTEIASRCVELAEQFAPSNQWFIQIMNKVFEHAGDLVNIKVAHNLMRLIAEGFGEDDDDADSKLRLSAVESYLQIMSEPKLPSLFLQVISWVLGEYGTADGKYSASYISGKLCDVADAYSSDETVKGYAVSALMKIYAFEIASGRKVDVLPECQSLIEELLASHSTDLQQRAYELQALLALDARAVESILPLDASCEDIEVDKDLSFLNGYIQQAIESGAQPYISERERSGMLETTDYHSQDHHEVPSHALRFEAYERPKPSSLPTQASTELVPVPEPSYYSEAHQPISTSSVSERESSEIKLRLDGVKQKWGRPSYQSSTSASSTPPQAANGTSSHPDVGVGSSSLKPRSSYESKKPEIDPEKQRLAASLFGGSSSSRSDRKSSSGGHKPAKGTASKPPKENPIPVQPPPDLLDFGEPTATGVTATDPFKELEGLMDSSSQDGGSTDVMGVLYSDAAPVTTTTSVDSLLSELSDSSKGNPGTYQSQTSKGPNSKEALEKDALVRQMGVNPTSQNPTLFKDLLG